ncbi:MAG: arylsulfotransferase family protein [Pseudomonadota bacterium]
MGRNLPVWLFLLCALLGGIAMVGFGWMVQATISGDAQTGVLGRTALRAARFPDKAIIVFDELWSYLTGSYIDEPIRVPRETGDLSAFRLVEAPGDRKLEGLYLRADPEAARGWRILLGAFAFDDRIENAALLFSPELELVRISILDEAEIAGEKPNPNHKRFPHGVAVLDDFSLIFAFDGGRSLQRIDPCGERVWAIPGKYHHAVSRDGPGESVWSLRDLDFVQVAAADGDVLRTISMDDVIARNPSIDILEIRRLHDNDIGGNSRNTEGKWLEEAMHTNDIEPLPEALADRFAGMEAGDLLISMRSLNLVFVLDPETLVIKWWRAGAAQRQHDPDWQPNGEITIFDNRMSRDFSQITAITPLSYETRTLYADSNFYTRIRGKHQVTSEGHILITSTQQGRAFEVDPSGQTLLEFVNTKPDSETTNYAISELIWLPPDALDLEGNSCES